MIEGVVCGKGSHEARRRVIEQAINHGTHRYAAGFIAAKDEKNRFDVADRLVSQWEHATLMIAMDQLA